jgi:NAD-dependent deacetylase
MKAATNDSISRPGARLLVITGAGISAESGIPTFRGPGGYWRNLDPTKLATESAFHADPSLVWEWYRERRQTIRQARPNAAHVAVAQLAAQARDFLLLTQNVDDLHQRAEWQGRTIPPGKIVQIHGDIFVSRCARCDFSRREPEREPDSAANLVPTCPDCGSRLRPGVVWFGETLPLHAVRRVEEFLFRGECDLTLVVGTTALFGYIVQWALAAKGRRGRLIEINLEESPISAFATETLREPAALALPRLVAR